MGVDGGDHGVSPFTSQSIETPPRSGRADLGEICPQDGAQARGNGHLAILPPLAVHHAQRARFEVERLQAQAHELLGAESGEQQRGDDGMVAAP